MADPTSTISRDFVDNVKSWAWKIKSAEAMTRGAAAMIMYGTGLAEFAGDDAGGIPAGLVVGPEDGNSLTGTALATEADPGAVLRGGCLVKDVTVTGVSAYGDIGKFVYATDGQTFTLTRPADDAAPFGIVIDKSRATTTTTCDVYFFSFVESVMLAASGGTKRVMNLGFVAAHALLDVTDNAKLLDVQLFGHGRISKIYAVSMDYDTNWSAGDVQCNFSIGGTTIKDTAAAAINIGLLATTIDAATDRGTSTDLDVAIGTDGSEVFHDGDNLVMDIVNSGSTATAGGLYGGWNIYAEIETLPGS